MRKKRQLVIGILLSVALLMHAWMTMRVGFMSDDYSLIHSAQNGMRFWHLHSSLPLEFLWKKTGEGHLSAFVWHVGLWVLHVMNVGLFYVLARWCKLTPSFSLLAATFYALSPAGIEALAWTCSAGYVLTMTWILASLVCFLMWREHSEYQWLKGSLLAVMQIFAFLTWEWGILVFPILCVFCCIAHMRGWKLLIPVGICWLGALTVRSFSDHGVFWQHNDFVTAARFLFGSPLLGLFPNLNKESYFSVPILFLFVAMVLFLGRAAWKQGIVLALLICFFGAVVPWVRGGNPSSRYFYLAMPFLYLALTLALQQLKSQYIAWGIATALLVSQFWSTYERAVLWVEADQQAHALMKEVVVLLSTFPSEKMVIVNVPEAYGPQQMPMRPQMWYCGFKEYLRGRNIDVALVKTDDSPFVWERSPDRLSRDAVAAAYPEKTLYEVVYHQERFTLVPFNQSAFENKS